MAYLDNTTITVDAILTKKGRERLASGGKGVNGFHITQFALADDEIDYTLYNTTHPSGSAYYGEAIENMPLLEAFPDENHVMRYKLVTLPKNTQKMPVISIQPEAVTFTAGGGLNQPKITITPSTANVTDSSYTFILHDQSVVNMEIASGAGAGAPGASTPFFLGEDDAPNSKTVVANSVRISLIPLSASTPDGGKATQLTVIGNDTGATSSITITNKVRVANATVALD